MDTSIPPSSMTSISPMAAMLTMAACRSTVKTFWDFRNVVVVSDRKDDPENENKDEAILSNDFKNSLRFVLFFRLHGISKLEYGRSCRSPSHNLVT